MKRKLVLLASLFVLLAFVLADYKHTTNPAGVSEEYGAEKTEISIGPLYFWHMTTKTPSDSWASLGIGELAHLYMGKPPWLGVRVADPPSLSCGGPACD